MARLESANNGIIASVRPIIGDMASDECVSAFWQLSKTKGRGGGGAIFALHQKHSSPEPFCSKMDSDGKYSRVIVVTVL